MKKFVERFGYHMLFVVLGSITIASAVEAGRCVGFEAGIDYCNQLEDN